MRFGSVWFFGALSVLLPTVVHAQSMNAEAFYARATALQSKGIMALFSGGEIKALTAEAKAAGASARQQRLAAVAAGKQPRYCPPTASGSMTSNELIQRLSAIPADDRSRMTMTDAMTRILAAKFPCRT